MIVLSNTLEMSLKTVMQHKQSTTKLPLGVLQINTDQNNTALLWLSLLKQNIKLNLSIKIAWYYENGLVRQKCS